MAYTKIKPVKHHLQRCLDYTSNPKKTEKFSADDLNRLLSYTQNQNKTEHQLYVTGFRCNPATAYRRMYRTKKRWNQPMDEGDILAYHIIQSFSPGEATPDQVHKIGCEFARRFLADRFECTVSTHLDKGHLHNHIVVNSVSYADGKMFRNNFDTYYHGIRQVSDELCRENRLSVIETDGKGKSYDEWLSGQAGKPTIRGMVRKDVEQAIAAADSFDGFILELQNMGYTVKYGPRVEHIAVRHKDAQRNIRIDRLDPRFSETALREYYRQLHRMPTEMQQEYRQENAPAKPKWQPTELQPIVRRARYLGKLPRRYPKVSGFMACYYHYCALLRKAYHGKSTKRCYFLLREDFLLFSRYQQQTKFLWENHIETMQRIQDTFWAMHEITYEVEEVDTTPEPTEDDPDPEQQTDYILHITVSSKTVDELAELYNFTQDQKDILHQLLSEEMRPSLLALCGGIAVADGELCWPLPGHTYISCHFGEVDAFGNAGHRGTDIPAPEGTPILAAHSGTVLVSGWNDSYGNQVLLDNGAGLSTRYAHMTQTAVTAGEAVTAGQIIGYVGSTGDSTGNHLHFEVMQNGVRMNPLELVFAQ